MLKVGERVERHFVRFEKSMDVEFCLKPQELPYFLSREDTLPESLQGYAFQNPAGKITPPFLKTLP
jgi:hypothetical protein